MTRHPASDQAADQPESIEARMAQLERLVRSQQDVIADQQERIAQLEGHDTAGPAPTSASAVPAGASSRRTLLKLGGAAAAAGMAAAAASALELAHPGTAHARVDAVTNGPWAASGAGNIASEGDGTSSAVGIKGTSAGSVGVWGTSDISSGVLAQSGSGAGLQAQSTSGIAVVGSSTSGNGVSGTSNNAYGGSFQGGLAPLFLTPSSKLGGGAPTSGAHVPGELYVDILGALWYCTVAGNPGTWVLLSHGPPTPPPTPHGLLTYLSAPIRLFDTRSDFGQGVPLPVSKGALAGQSTTTIQVTGTIPVPAGATGVFGNLTVSNTQGGGDLILYPSGAQQPNASNINYVQGQTIANSFNVGLSSGGAMDLFVHVHGTDVIIDIAGYVM